MKKFLSFVLVLAMILSVSSFAIAAGGSGTEADPFLIGSADELAAFRNAVNGGDSYKDKYVKLTTSIELTEDPWVPIGNATIDSPTYTGNAFKGTFDGGGYTISGLTSSLFGVVDGATIKNLKLDVNITGTNDRVGAAARMMVGNATVSNITASGSISGAKYVGGVVGAMTIEGAIEDCTNNATINGSTYNIGGIVGAAYYTQSDKYMTVSGCTNNGEVSGPYAVGGIVGLSTADIYDCTNTAAITASNMDIGGIVGEQKVAGSVIGCTNTGNVTNTGSGYGTGGIIGWVRYPDYPSGDYGFGEVVEVSGNKNSGTIKGGNDAGGIVGTMYNAAKVSGNENTATNISATTFAAGIVGNVQFTETVGGGIPQNKVNIINNVSTTVIDSINGSCKNLYAFDNSSGEQEGTIEDNSDAWVAQIGDIKYATLQAAVEAAKDDDTITLLSDCSGNGIVIDKSITIDFGGFTYTVDKAPLAGSEGTKTQAFQLLKNNNITMKNGTIAAGASSGVKMLVQNYSNLTLNNMKLDGTNIGNGNYTLSNNYGNIAIDDTEIIAPTDGVAFDVYDYTSGGYDSTPKVTVSGDKTKITGNVEVSDTATLQISGGKFSVQPEEEWLADGMKAEKGDDETMWGVVEDKPATESKPASSGSGISVKYNGGNSFSTSNPSVPTGVEIDGVPVTFNGTGSNFSVGCISSDAKWVTVRWNSTSVTTNFTPDGLVECTTVSIPKTGDMSFWAAIAQFLGF